MKNATVQLDYWAPRENDGEDGGGDVRLHCKYLVSTLAAYLPAADRCGWEKDGRPLKMMGITRCFRMVEHCCL